MDSNNIFSINRVYQLLIRYYTLNYKGILIASVAFSGALAIIGAVSSFASNEFRVEAFVGMFYASLFVAGVIVTSKVFRELHKPSRSIHYLTLPASPIEKLLTAWISTSIFYLLIAMVLFYFTYYISSLLTLWWFNFPMVSINIFEYYYLKVCLHFIILHSIFFFGAVYFKGYNFLKMVLSIFVIVIGFSMYQSLISAITMKEMFHSIVLQQGPNQIIADGAKDFVENVFVPTMKYIYYAMPVFFLSLSFIRFNEREA